MSALEDVNLRELLSNNRLIIGSERTLKFARQNKLKAIFIASNAPETLRNEAKIIAKALGIEIKEVEENSKQIGTRLGKPYTVLMLGILK